MDIHKNDNDKISLPDHKTTDLKFGDIKKTIGINKYKNLLFLFSKTNDL
tara:strand:+ start:407 stop:553 length:147 start_codon:yes stop_codon:yes gene_type:complete